MNLWSGIAFSVALCVQTALPARSQSADLPDNATLMARLVAAYPSQLKGFEGNDLIWQDGTRMPFDDGIDNKPFETLLERPSIKDQFRMVYSPGESGAPPAMNFDPGRVRNEAFFNKMYGDCTKDDLKGKLTSIAWVPKYQGGRVAFTTVNDAAKHLSEVSAELETLSKDDAKYLAPSAGTLNCRSIAGTTRKSMHAYGAAIDINTKYSDYWRWARGEAGKDYKNQIPYAVIAIFEKHGFIWGGKWSHFDTMHFEYRPELLGPSSALN